MANDTPIPLGLPTRPPTGAAGGSEPSQTAGPGGGFGVSTLPTAAAVLANPHEPATSLYIHTPFCVHKCHYCDFYSFVDNRDQQAVFVERLIAELRFLAPHAGPVKTIFIGGGTPSLLRVELWSKLLGALHECFDLSVIAASKPTLHADGLNDSAEFTVECNPESASPELLGTLRAGGVNRVSIGAQSFIPRHLKTLERWHDPDNVARAIEAARAAGIPRQSIDLIFAIPGQTLDEWRSDLDRALALGTTHLSCYNLTYEPNTPMTVRLKRGEFTPVNEDLEADMFTLTGDLLADKGLNRYEVSNYARPGHESTHNLAYWRQESWLAAGPSASGHVRTTVGTPRGHLTAGHRWKNAPNLGTYLASAPGPAPIADHEAPDPARYVRELLMMGLRLSCGIDIRTVAAMAEQASPGAAARLEQRAAEFVGDGLLEAVGGRWRVTPRGWLLADFIAKKMMATV
ncbi:MAG: radical SAM family heme chaperone HemW [Phycisphaerales bacterium]